MTQKLNWKMTNDRDALVGFYRDYPLYKIELTANEDPKTFNELFLGYVVAYSHPCWAKLCENLGFSSNGEQVSGPDSTLSPGEVNSTFRVTSELLHNTQDVGKLMEEFKGKADLDFAYRRQHVDVM